MRAYTFTDNYGGNLQGSSLILGTRLSRILSEQGISSLYLSRDLFGDKGHIYRFIQASPQNKHGSFDIEAEVRKGRIKIPRGMIEYAGLGRNKTSIIGMPGGLGIWNTRVLDSRTKQLTDRQMKNVSRFLTERSERESEDFLSDSESEHD